MIEKFNGKVQYFNPVLGGDGKLLRGSVRGEDPRHDVAVLALDADANRSDWLATAPQEPPPTGAWVGHLA